MQAEATRNFQVPYRLSQLCGALDLQIEHHMFPRLPPNRLREIAPEIREICEAHGVSYRTGSWPSVLLGAFRHLWNLSKPTEKEAAAAASRPALGDALWGNHAGA